MEASELLRGSGLQSDRSHTHCAGSRGLGVWDGHRGWKMLSTSSVWMFWQQGVGHAMLLLVLVARGSWRTCPCLDSSAWERGAGCAFTQVLQRVWCRGHTETPGGACEGSPHAIGVGEHAVLSMASGVQRPRWCFQPSPGFRDFTQVPECLCPHLPGGHVHLRSELGDLVGELGLSSWQGLAHGAQSRVPDSLLTSVQFPSTSRLLVVAGTCSGLSGAT